MAGVKRKIAAPIGISDGSRSKKIKKENRESAPLARDLETATDSDPIVESDTTEHGGEGDGESWPSDNEGKEVEHSHTPVIERSKKIDHEEKSDGLPKGQMRHFATLVSLLNNLQYQTRESLMQSKKRWLKSARPQNRMPTQ